MSKFLKLSLFAILILSLSAFLAACGNSNTEDSSEDSNASGEDGESGEVNLYTSRHYETDQALYDTFTEETGIKVNVVEGSGDELIERLNQEGESTEADLFITADAGNLHAASESGLLQPVESDVLNGNIPEKFRDVDNEWFGLTKRARVIVYDKERVDPSELSTYEALTEPEWEDRIAIRSSSNMYNISLLASFIELNGSEEAASWAGGITNNMAIEPQGGDRDQAKAVAAGQADVAVMNTYYIGGMLNSEDPEEVKVAESLGVFFPNQETTGTHVNISGISMTKSAKNAENAQKLMEFLSNEKSQEQFASANYEYPVNPNVEVTGLLESWGEFKEQDINLSVLGENQQEAIRLFDQAGWK
ncbi:Fe(3+) ABC transporter substrate-binding protein [Jeotgalibacillus sp. S-D1]|uniref:Fe(3+) ABC transporter substrate-binding protein n=1 Tax=Jeotgalibacillus sp. S-D1 TaxID=2552189 RepID=UPI00105A9C3F|nr:Fe(3+) ABC transporter substrate-binding protein [Jeotgalibacillus sp. S-D1]TDL30832.1 Fe(3+) ABC transporter substrate-binding protein [Jeotgalibacillus sp. S-D1]